MTGAIAASLVTDFHRHFARSVRRLCRVLVCSLRECLCGGSFRGCLRGGFQSRVFARSRGTRRLCVLSCRLRILTGCSCVLTGSRIL